MWVWLAAAWAAWAVAAATGAECPAECRCSCDNDGLWSAECATSVLTAWPPPTASPQLKALRLKPAAARHKPIRLRASALSHRFPNLWALHLANSSLAGIPAHALAGLKSLDLLDLSYNRLRDLGGSSFSGLPALRTLVLRGNPALALSPTDPLHSMSLTELDLGQCGLSTLPSLENLPALQRLAVDGNRLTSFNPYTLPQTLRMLDVAGNSVADVPKNLQHLRHLKHVDLRDNPVLCTCGLLFMHDWLSGNGVTLEAVCARPSGVAGQRLANVNEDAVCRGELGEQMLGDQPSHDAETLFSNEETRRMGTHMEKTGRPSWAESTEGSGYGSDLLDDSSPVGSPRSSFEFVEEGSGDGFSMSRTTDADSSVSNKSDQNVVTETDDFTASSESKQASSSTDKSTTEDNIFEIIPSESTSELTPSTTEDSYSTSVLSSSSSTPQPLSSEYPEETFIASSSTEETTPTSTTEEPILTSSTTEEESSPSSTEVPTSSSTEFSISVTSEEPTSSSTTEEPPPIIIISPDSQPTEKPILAEINNESESSPDAASSSDEVEGATEAAAAAAGGVQEDSSWGAILIGAAVVGPLAILGATAAWRRRRRSAPRKLRLDGSGGGTTPGAELQDMGPLLPQPVQPPAQVLPPEERPLNLSNGAAPVRATARLTVLPDSVPRTPVFVHKSVVS